MHIWATKQELEKSRDFPEDRLVLVTSFTGSTGEARWAKGGYLATLGVYHELHCLVSD